MAERRPIVNIDGQLQELPTGDTLPGGGSGLQNNLAATAAPLSTDDSGAGYAVGSRWVDVTNDNTYTCVDASVGAAVWVQENQTTETAPDGFSTTFTTSGPLSTSSSAFATKGTVFTMDQSRFLISVEFLDATPPPTQTVSLFIAELDAGGLITNILLDVGVVSVVDPGTSQLFTLPAPVLLEANKTYTISFVRTDGVGTDPLSISFPSAAGATDVNGHFTLNTYASRIASTAPTIGTDMIDETLTANATAHMTLTTEGVSAASSFTGLTDTPSNFTGQTLKGIRVNAGETALEFTDLVTSLTNLTDVDTATTPPTDGQALTWDNANNIWIPSTISGGAGGGGGKAYPIARYWRMFQMSAPGTDVGAAEIEFRNVAGTRLTGTVSASSVHTSPTFDADQAYDQNTATEWVAQTNNNEWYQIDLGAGNEDTVRTIAYTTRNTGAENQGATQFTLQFSQDALAWYDVGTYGGPAFTTALEQKIFDMDPFYYALDGLDGNTILNGTVDPTTEGVDGDFYINTTSNTLFGPKASGTWPAGVSLGSGPNIEVIAERDFAVTAAPNFGADVDWAQYSKVFILLEDVAWPTGFMGIRLRVGGVAQNGASEYTSTHQRQAANGVEVADYGFACTLTTGTTGWVEWVYEGDVNVKAQVTSLLTDTSNQLRQTVITANAETYDGIEVVTADGSNFTAGKVKIMGIKGGGSGGGSSTLDGLTDVSASSPTDGQALAWDNANSIWTPTTISSGTPGADGRTILNGTVDPTTEGVDGDFYINTTTNTIFGPKASGTWPAGVSLVGPNGSIDILTDVDTTTTAPTDGQALIWDNANSIWIPGTVSGGGGGAIPVQDDATEIVAAPTALNFTGHGVTVTDATGVATINVPAPLGYENSVDVTTAPSPSTSSSGFHIKANLAVPSEAGRITHINFRTDIQHAGEVFAAIVDSASSSMTIQAISKESYASVTTGTGAENNIALSTPLEFNANDILLIGVNRTDGTATDNCGTYFQTLSDYNTGIITSPANNIWAIRSSNITDLNPEVGDVITAGTFDDNWTIDFTYQTTLVGYLPTGGGLGHVLTKRSSNDFDMAWIDPEAPLTYRYWRLKINQAGTQSGGTVNTIAEIQFRPTIGGVDAATNGTASASIESWSSVAANAFDDSPSTWWGADADPTSVDTWIAYDFGAGNELWVAEYTVQGRAGSEGPIQTPQSFTLQYSADGIVWVDSDTRTTSWSSGNETQTFTNTGEQPSPGSGTTINGLNDVGDVNLDPLVIGSGDVGRPLGLINDNPVTYGLIERLTSVPVAGGIDILNSNDFGTNNASELVFADLHLYDEVYIVGWGLIGSGSGLGLLQIRQDGINPTPVDIDRMTDSGASSSTFASSNTDDFFISTGGFGDGLSFVAHIKGTKSGIPLHMVKTSGVKSLSYYHQETAVARTLAETRALAFISETTMTAGFLYGIGIRHSAQPITVPFDYSGSPGAAGTLARYVLPMDTKIRIGAQGQFKVTTNPTTQTVIEIHQNGVSIGTITIPATTGDPTVSITADTDLSSGDIIVLHATASGDFTDLYGSLLMEGRG